MSKTPPETRNALRDKIDDATDTAAEMARDEAEAVKAQAASETRKAAQAAENASDASESDSLQGEAAQHVAAGLQHVANALHDTDISEATRKTKQFARENPALFLGSAALLGFAAARFLKSSDRTRTRPVADDIDPWVGHVTATTDTSTPHHVTRESR